MSGWPKNPALALGRGRKEGPQSPDMSVMMRKLDGLSVRVDDVIYMPSLDAPDERPHPFVYFISIKNESGEKVTIRGRKWIVREDDGEVTVVEGDGVGEGGGREEEGETQGAGSEGEHGAKGRAKEKTQTAVTRTGSTTLRA